MSVAAADCMRAIHDRPSRGGNRSPIERSEIRERRPQVSPCFNPGYRPHIALMHRTRQQKIFTMLPFAISFLAAATETEFVCVRYRAAFHENPAVTI
jgi:hypothetical protein